MKFYHYSQNNSGGSFDLEEEAGITNHVVIEAEDDKDANRRAEDIGIYFDGVSDGHDCSCCGDRWSEVYKDDGEDEPKIYDESPSDYVKNNHLWMDPGKEVCVHYADGRKEWF